MGRSSLQSVVRHLRRIARPGAELPSSDATFLGRFADDRDEAAFAEIVRRHGPLVWAMCRGRLSAADADDAFQATFLVFTKQAARIRKPGALAAWLAGVAKRVVHRSRAKEDRRLAAERRLPAPPSQVVIADWLEQEEWRQALNEELHRLPEKYLLPMLLCYYQGLTNEEAARRLGWPAGTVCGRLARARNILRGRLIRRGVTLSAAALTAGAAGPPADLLAATLTIGGSLTNIGTMGTKVTASAMILAEAVMNAMWVGKVRTCAIGLLGVAAIGGGIGGYAIGPATGRGDAPMVVVARAADPLPPEAKPMGKIPEIEQAGKALVKGDMDEAYRLLQQAVTKYPADLPPARLMLARLYMVAHRRNDAQQFHAIMDQAAVENPDHPIVYLDLARCAVAEGRNAEAVLDCMNALQLSGAARWTADQRKDMQIQAWSTLAQVHEMRREWAEMRERVAKLLEEFPKDGHLRQRLALALVGLGKDEDAYRELARATKDTPALGPPALGMAALFSQVGNVKKAREWFDKAIKEKPLSFDEHLESANSFITSENLGAAKLHAEQAEKLRPGEARVVKLRQRMADAEKAVKVDPPNPP